MRRVNTTAIVVGFVSLASVAAAAGPDRRGPPANDAYQLWIHSETYAQLFERALLPGPNGVLVANQSVVPVHEYLRLEVRDLDTAWQADSVDVELAAWGRAWFGERESERRLDGDIQTAQVRLRQGPLSLRLGRQHVAGGAARYARFDGLELEAELGAGLEVAAYGGFTVLPRWDQRAGYRYLGAAPDGLLRDPEAVPEPARGKENLAGGRLSYSSEDLKAGLSFHEQHETLGLARRSLGVDARAAVLPETSAGSAAIFELDARRFQDARFWLDSAAFDPLDVSVEYLHSEPALFLSRQSVLAVFSTSSYEEAGGLAGMVVAPELRLEGGGWVEFYAGGERGARSELTALITPNANRDTLLRTAYARVVAPSNAYHSLRSSLSRRLLSRLTGTLEAYGYFYDEAISGRHTSTVYAGTLNLEPLPALGLLLGASFVQSPYASFDAQTLLRVSYDLDYSVRRAR